ITDHPRSIMTVDLRSGARKAIGHEWQSVSGLAWWPDGREIWFAGEDGMSARAVRAVTLDGDARLVAAGPGALSLEDIAADGRVLVTRENQRGGIIAMTGGGEPRARTHDKISHRNARWFPDGRRILFQGNAPGEASRIWVQDVAGGAPRAITPQNVNGTQVTPDGTRVLGRAPDRHFYVY